MKPQNERIRLVLVIVARKVDGIRAVAPAALEAVVLGDAVKPVCRATARGACYFCGARRKVESGGGCEGG
jgi:hypothetical protein